MIDKLVVSGLPPLDGEYPCDLIEMIGIGSAESLTVAEAHRVKKMSDVRQGELVDAVSAGDAAVIMALAAVVLTRSGKRYDEQRLLATKPEVELVFQMGDREDQEADADPPAIPTPETGSPSVGGGNSSSDLSESLEPDQSPTGHLVSVKPVISDPETLAI